MLTRFSLRALGVGAALALTAGCAGNALAPSQSPTSLYRTLRGPDVTGPIIVSTVPTLHNVPRGWPLKKQKQILFVADGSNGVLMFDPTKKNGASTGSITDGVDDPDQVAVDSKGTLYVANAGSNSITEYPAGKTSPSVTITTGLSDPYGVTVDSKGDVFASNLNSNEITAYKKGKKSPYLTIDFASYGQAVGLGVDGKDNVWVACDTTSTVYEIPAGKKTAQNAGLSGLQGTLGVSFGIKDVMYVSNVGGSNVSVYKYGSKSPSTVITDGIEKYGPTLGGFTSTGYFFQTNQGLNVVGYEPNKTKPFSTLSVTSPLGIASSPLVTK